MGKIIGKYKGKVGNHPRENMISKLAIIMWSQDGGIGGHGVHLSSQVHQEYIYKWDKSYEHLLNTSGGPRTLKRTGKILTQLGWMKERKKKR